MCPEGAGGRVRVISCDDLAAGQVDMDLPWILDSEAVQQIFNTTIFADSAPMKKEVADALRLFATSDERTSLHRGF